MENSSQRSVDAGVAGGGGERGKLQQKRPEGERILAPTRRPDGTFRKAIRIRAGYVPQDEVAIYQSKGALLKKSSQEPDVPPGYDPTPTKTKSAKRNERKKEKKKLQAALASSDDRGKNIDLRQEEAEAPVVSSADRPVHGESVESITSQMNVVSVSSTNSSVGTEQVECQDSGASSTDLDKKIRAIKKKIRHAESQQNGIQQDMKPEKLEKLEKVKGWREELKCLEDKKAGLAT